VLYVAPEHFRASPQVGVQRRIAWAQLSSYLSRTTTGTAKDAAGAWSPALYRDGVRRKQAIVCVYALVVDVDEGGDVDLVASALARYAAVVHETFSSTPATPRCRVVILFAEPVDTMTYERTHVIVRAHLRVAGIVADEGAKDASRLSFAPVRRPGTDYRVRVIDGQPLSAARVIAAQRPLPSRRSQRRVEHDSSYACGALRRAAEAVATAREGTRNETLNRETYCLARLDDLDDVTIETEMLDAALAVGLSEREARRTIAGAIRSRRGAQ